MFVWEIILTLLAAGASYFIPTPMELQNTFKGAQTIFASANFPKAIEQYDIIISTNSEFLEEDSVKVTLFDGELTVGVIAAATYQKANALKNLKQPDSSIVYFRKVEVRKDEPVLAALSQFQIYDINYRLKNYDSAIVNARKLVDKYPSHPKAEAALYDIGWAYREKNQLELSNQALLELLVKYPNSDFLARAIYQLGQNYYDLKNFDDAIKYWSELNEKFKPESFKNQDWEKIQLKSVKERQIFEATAGRETNEFTLELVAKAQVKIGDAYRQKGDYENAMLSYRKIVITFTLIPVLIEVAYIKMADYTSFEKGSDETVDIYQEAIDENFANRELQAKMQYKIAELYQLNGLYERAAREFSFYVRAYPDVAQAIEFDVDKAQYSVIAMYYNARLFQKAVDESDTLLTNFPFSDIVPAGLFIRGLALSDLGKYSDARDAFNRIVSDFKQSADFIGAKIQVGYTLFKEAKYEESLLAYKDVIENYSGEFDSSQVYFDLMNVYFELKRYDEAIASFTPIKFGSQYFAPAFGRVAKIYAIRSEYDNGINFLNGIAKQDSSIDSVYYAADINFALADIYISKNDYSGAIKFLTIVVSDSLIPENRSLLKLQAQYARGVLQYQVENYQSAITDLEFVLAQENFHKEFGGFVYNANEKLALAYSKAGDKNKALQLADKLMQQASGDKEKGMINSLIAGIYFEAGDYKNAILKADEVLKSESLVDDIKIRAYLTISSAYQKQENISKAASVLLEASEKYPNSADIPNVLYSLGALYYDSQDYLQAADIFSKFIEKYPSHQLIKEARYFKGYAYYEAGEWKSAFNSFKQYLSNYPDDPSAVEMQFYSAEAMFNAKEFNTAIAEYRRVYQRFSSHDLAVTSMYNEGWCYFELQQSEKMIDIFKKLASRYPNSTYAADALFTVGDYYYNTKDYVKASESYSELITKFPNYEKRNEAETLVYDLAQINSYLEYEKAMKHFDGKNWEKAIEELKKLFEKFPDASIAVGCQVNIASSYEMLDEFKLAAEWYKKVIDKYSSSSDDNERAAVNFAREHLEWIESNY